MTKKLCFKIFCVFFFCILISCSTQTNNNTPEELGEKVFLALINNDLESLKELMVESQDLVDSFDHSKLDKVRKEKLKKEMLEKFEKSSEKTKNSITTGFQSIRNDIATMNCGDDPIIEKMKPETSQLTDLPFEIGTLMIGYSCGSEQRKVSVEIIKTDSGWHILEKLRSAN